MNKHLQSILFIAGLVLCTSFVMLMSPLETVDHFPAEDKPVAAEKPVEGSEDSFKTGNDLQSIVDQPYDLPTNMYIVRRGGTDRLRTTNENPVNTASESPENVAEPAETSSKKESQATVTTTPKKATQTTQTPAPAKTSQTKAKTVDELDLLARLITAEAQGEPYETKVAVGAVVMNRVKSSQFPNTIKEVIYQNIDGYIQFTPVANGWIDKPAQEDCIKAAKEAINGADPTNGALFFYSNKSNNAYMLEKQICLKSGNMNFTY